MVSARLRPATCACLSAARTALAICTQHLAKQIDEGQLPIGVKPLRQLLQAARQLSIPFDTQFAHRRRVIAAQHRQLPEQAAQAAAHAQIRLGIGIHRAYAQSITGHRDLQRKRWRGQRQCHPLPIQCRKACAGIRIQRQRVIQRDFQRFCRLAVSN